MLPSAPPSPRQLASGAPVVRLSVSREAQRLLDRISLHTDRDHTSAARSRLALRLTHRVTAGEGMNDLGLSLPLRIRRLNGAIGITDAAGRSAAYVYFTGDPDQRASTKRVGPVEAEAIARVIPEALKDALVAGLAPEGGPRLETEDPAVPSS